MQQINAYHFCPECKNPLHKQRGESLLTCKNNHHLYVNPTPTTAIILTTPEHKILLVRRARAPKKGWWDVPGGFIELEETAEQGARRELQEELGITLKKLTYLSSSNGYYDYAGIHYFTLAFCFTAPIETHVRLEPHDDVASYTFFSPHDIPWKRIAFPDVKKLLKIYLLDK